MGDNDARSWLSCLGWGCLAVVVLSALGIGGCVWLTYSGGSGAHQVTELYLQAVDAGRFEEAYAHLGPAFTGDHQLGEFVAFEQDARHRLGRCASWRASGTSLNRDSGRTTAELTYRLDCDAGATEVVLSLEKVEQSWLIQGIAYRSAEAASPPVCQKCGALQVPGARFCSSCGAALRDEPTPGVDDPGPSADPAR